MMGGRKECLGLLLAEGAEGVGPNAALAVEMFERAIEKSDCNATFKLALVLSE